MRVTSFCFAKRKSPKKRRPPVCDPFAVRRGKPASCRLRSAPWNSLCCCAAPLGQPRRVRARSTRAPTRVPPRNRPAAGAASRGGSRTSRQPDIHSGHRSLGPACAARGACAREVGPSAAMARVDVLPPVPLWMRRGAQGWADQGSRLSERSETERVRARPRQTRAPQVAPARSGGDADSGVAFLLGTFLWRTKEKCLACRATPGLRPQQRHAAPSTSKRKHYKNNSYQRISH